MTTQSPDRKSKRKRRAWRDQALGWLMLGGIPLTIALVSVFNPQLAAVLPSARRFIVIAWAAVVIFSSLILLSLNWRAKK